MNKIKCCVCEHTESLQELIDKATPKKVMFIDSQRRMYRKKWGKNSRYDGSCPVCSKHIYPRYNYCPHCGQKLDWRNINND